MKMAGVDGILGLYPFLTMDLKVTILSWPLRIITATDLFSKPDSSALMSLNSIINELFQLVRYCCRRCPGSLP